MLRVSFLIASIFLSLTPCLAAESDTIVKQLEEPAEKFEQRSCWDITCYYDQNGSLILWVRYFQSIGRAVTAYASVQKQETDYNFWAALHPRSRRSGAFIRRIYADQVIPFSERVDPSKDETACFLTPDAESNVPSEIETDGLLGLRVLRIPVYRARWEILQLWERIINECKSCGYDDNFSSIERAFAAYENGWAFTPGDNYWQPSRLGRFVLQAYETSRDYFRATCALKPRRELWRLAESDPLKPTDPNDVRPLRNVPADHLEIEEISQDVRDQLGDLEDRLMRQIEIAKKNISTELQTKN